MVGCAPGITSTAAAYVRPYGLSLNSYQTTSAAKQKHADKLMSIPGVAGVGIGRDEKDSTQGRLTVMIESDSAELRQQLSSALAGTEYNVLVTGRFSTR